MSVEYVDLKLVWVQWFDHYGPDGWTVESLTADFDDCIVESVGFLTHSSDDYIRIVPHVTSNKEQHRGGLDILRCCIKNMWEIRV